MKRRIILSVAFGVALFVGTASAQTNAAAYRTQFVTGKSNYVGKSVAHLLGDLPIAVGSFVLNPNYNYPDYSNKFRFANKDVNAVSAIIRDNQKLDSDELYLFYVKFKPQIKYPTAGFMRENREKPLTPAQYAEFEQYTVTDIEFSVFPR